ncbi:MAG TPA: transcriptional regulator [Clostridiales bacterium]|nr:transcriptional regulator [Clostridiales bacterium]
MDISKKVLEIRAKNRLTQEEMAQRLFVTRQAVSRWEKGDAIPNIDTLKMISQEFGVSADELLGLKRNRICQCCTYPLRKIDELGTNSDGTLNVDYCIYCFKDGAWVDPDLTAHGVIDYTIPFMKSPSMTEEQARKVLSDLVPTLKRWKSHL